MAKEWVRFDSCFEKVRRWIQTVQSRERDGRRTYNREYSSWGFGGEES